MNEYFKLKSLKVYEYSVDSHQITKGHEDQPLQGHLKEDVDVGLVIRDVNAVIDQAEALVITCSACKKMFRVNFALNIFAC